MKKHTQEQELKALRENLVATETLKNYLTNVVQRVIWVKELHKGFVDQTYINSKHCFSALDFETNRMVLNQILLDGLYTKSTIESFYQVEGLTGIWEIADLESESNAEQGI